MTATPAFVDGWPRAALQWLVESKLWLAASAAGWAWAVLILAGASAEAVAVLLPAAIVLAAARLRLTSVPGWSAGPGAALVCGVLPLAWVGHDPGLAAALVVTYVGVRMAVRTLWRSGSIRFRTLRAMNAVATLALLGGIALDALPPGTSRFGLVGAVWSELYLSANRDGGLARPWWRDVLADGDGVVHAAVVLLWVA